MKKQFWNQKLACWLLSRICIIWKWLSKFRMSNEYEERSGRPKHYEWKQEKSKRFLYMYWTHHSWIHGFRKLCVKRVPDDLVIRTIHNVRNQTCFELVLHPPYSLGLAYNELFLFSGFKNLSASGTKLSDKPGLIPLISKYKFCHKRKKFYRNVG